jgi:chromosome segregation ATPase
VDQAAMMGMVKNQHLLIAIAVLGLGSAVACLLLIVSESSNATDLAKLSSELQDARKQLQARNDGQIAETNQQVADLQKKYGELSQQHAILKVDYTRLHDAATKLEKDLATANVEVRTHETFLKSLKQQPWLADGEMPWDSKLKAHQERLKKVEDRLSMLEVKQM